MQLLFLLRLSLLSCWKGDPQMVKGLAFCPALSSAGLWTKAKAREVFPYLGFFVRQQTRGARISSGCRGTSLALILAVGQSGGMYL